MLYIFHVDTGTTITFDMKLALESVSQLKEAIERECGVPAAQQVLLVSGGESLEPNARVCTYSAGTDTNPIYLFSKASIESHQPPTPSIDYGSDIDLQTQIEASLAMPATYQTVVVRAQLGQQCCVLARDQTRICERLVHDQHLQQQGWAAVVANLEDITQMFESRAGLLQQSFSHYLSERQQHIDLLSNFNSDLGTLSKIPILPALRSHAEGCEPASAESEEAEGEIESETKDDEVLSLLKWISAKDNQSTLEQVAEQCSKGLEQFDEKVMESLKTEVNAAIDAANKQDMKEIKGLGERLYRLEQLMFEAKKLVQEQGDLAQAFLQNQNRASNLGDASILPDLCASHRRQLMVMLQNHNHLRDIRRRCTKAKEELSVNLYHRLKWIMYVENKMMEVDSRLVMYHESLRRLRRHLEVLQQIHMAPQMYMSAVAEVVRRRTFSQAFLVWASNLACQLLTVHSEELTRRRDFQSKFEGHFLNTLFPGLEDTPPSFATQAPSVFDGSLPKLTLEDMESLKQTLPDLGLTISTPDLDSITQFFLSKSLTEGCADVPKEKECQDLETEALDKRRAPLLSDRGGFESETDTEEFENIGQTGPTDLKRISVDEASPLMQKQLEVGRSKSLSSASNRSSLSLKVTNEITTSRSDNSPLLASTTNRVSQLGTLVELVEDSFSTPESRAPNDPQYSIRGHSNPNDRPRHNSPSINPAACDGQQLSSTGSSPSTGDGAHDFTGTEFYMDESLPSSLSEHPIEAHHQAIVSLLQENLVNTRDEVERLRSLLRSVKSLAGEALSAVRQELSTLRECSTADQNGLTELTEGVRKALEQHSSECERLIREREQELTVDHELELTDLKKMMQVRDEEIRVLKQSLVEKSTELTEAERLLTTLRQKMESDQSELQVLRSRVHLTEDALAAVGLEKELALKDAQEASAAEIAELNRKIETLQETLSSCQARQEEAIRAATEKFQKEYKKELDTIRSRFKLMAASTMERSPSDSSLEKIERPDIIELVNHEAILAQVKEDMKMEKASAVRAAIEKERSDCAAKLDHELRLARQRNEAEKQVWFSEAMRRVVEEKDRQVEAYRAREAVLSKECDTYKDTIRRLTETESMMRQTLTEKVESLEADKVRLEANIEAERNTLHERESQLENLTAECDKLREEVLAKAQLKLGDGGLNMTDALKLLESKNERLECMNAGADSRLQKLEAEKDKLKAELKIYRKSDDVDVSESKKVRLESNSELEALLRKVEILEGENKILAMEIRMLRNNKEMSDAKVENAGITDARPPVGGGTVEMPEKDMSASVAVVPESSSRDAATSPEPSRRDASAHLRDKLTRSTANLIQQARICISSCNPGDVVLVVWDTQHRNYILLQESSTFYFLHSDCIDALDLRVNSDGTPKRTYAIAEVLDKEYCHAKKSENRYRVPQGTKFYRVRVRPQQSKDVGQMSSTSKQQPLH